MTCQKLFHCRQLHQILKPDSGKNKKNVPKCRLIDFYTECYALKVLIVFCICVILISIALARRI